jgi:hypothetical protein
MELSAANHSGHLLRGRRDANPNHLGVERITPGRTAHSLGTPDRVLHNPNPESKRSELGLRLPSRKWIASR